MKIASIFGNVAPPPGVSGFAGGQVGGISVLLNIVLRTMIVAAGVYAVFNLILAGYAYISAGGDSKAVAGATAKITQSIIGLTVAAGAFIIAGVISQILFGNATTLLSITIFQP
jgi:hypothetical protein